MDRKSSVCESFLRGAGWRKLGQRSCLLAEKNEKVANKWKNDKKLGYKIKKTVKVYIIIFTFVRFGARIEESKGKIGKIDIMI